MSKRRIYLRENSDIRFDMDEQTGETVMSVCNEEFTRKRIPLFSETLIRKYFKEEIEQHKDFVCPTGLEEKGESEV